MSAATFTAEDAKRAEIELISEPKKGRQAVHEVGGLAGEPSPGHCQHQNES